MGAILPAIPVSFPLPILVVQHMPPLFTRLLAERLRSACKLKVEEASHGTPVAPGRILIAPGDFHMKVGVDGDTAQILLDQSPPLNVLPAGSGRAVRLGQRGVWRRGAGRGPDRDGADGLRGRADAQGARSVRPGAG